MDDDLLNSLLAQLASGEEGAVRDVFHREGADTVMVLQQVAILYLHLERYADAQRCLSEACQAQPDNPLLLNDLGVVLYRQNKTFEAHKVFHQALAINPDLSSARDNARELDLVFESVEPDLAAMRAALCSRDTGRAATSAATVLQKIPDHPQAVYVASLPALSLAGHRPLEALLEGFRQAYARLDYGLAADLSEEALQRFPYGAYRYFVGYDGSKWLRTLNETGRLDEAVASLDAQLVEYPGLNQAVEDRPETAAFMASAREQKISQGLPSALLITQKKSGSITLATVFSEGFGLPCYTYSLIFGRVIPSWAKDYARGGASYVTHLAPDPVNIRALKEAGLHKPIVHVRDPRQALLSWVHHIVTYAGDFPEHIASGYKDWPIERRIDAVFAEYYSSIAWLDGWLNAAQELDVLFSTFEEFKRDPADVVQRYLKHYGADISLFDGSRVFVENEGIDYHRRKGEIDEWRQVMTPAQIERMNLALPQRLCDHFGWER